MNTARTISVAGPDSDGTLDRLLSSLTRSYLRLEGPADVVILVDTAFLPEAASSAAHGVVVVNPRLRDVTALGMRPTTVPVILSENVAGSPAVLESMDRLRSVIADATFVDVSALNGADGQVADDLFQQVRLLSVLDPNRVLALGAAHGGERVRSTLGTWGDADVSLFAATASHELSRITATVHAPGRVARIVVPTSATLQPGRVSIEDKDGEFTFPAKYYSGHRALLQSIDPERDRTLHAATLQRFLDDAHLIRSVVA